MTAIILLSAKLPILKQSNASVEPISVFRVPPILTIPFLAPILKSGLKNAKAIH